MSIYDRIPKQAAKVEHTAAGTFISDKTPPVFPPNTHPVDKYFNGDLDQRKHYLYTTIKVEGSIFRYRNKLMTMNELAIGFDPVDDIDELTPLLTGALGLEVSRSLPVSTRLNDALADTMALVPEEESVHFNSATELPNDCFTDHATPRQNAIDRPFEGKVFLIRLPLSCPRVKGVDVLEGLVTSPDVIESLQEYHPRAGAWARAHSSIIANSKCLVGPSAVRKLDKKFIPADNSKIPFSKDPFTNVNPLIITGDEEEDNLWHLTNDRILIVKNRNIAKYKANNPDQEVPPMGRPQYFPPVVAQPAPVAAKETLLQGKHKRAVMSHRLILGSLNKRENIVEVPDLAERFLVCWETSEFESVVRDYKNSVSDFCKERTQDTRDYFFRSIAESVWSNATYTLFLKGINHDRGMDEQAHNLSHAISILNFLPEDRSKNNEEYMKYLAQLGVENMEINVEEEKEKRQKIGYKLYLGGLQSHHQHIITAIANLDAHYAFMTGFDILPQSEQPLLVVYLRKIADILSSTDFSRFSEKYLESFPWIPHMILCQVQLLFGAFAAVARNNRYIGMIEKEEQLPASIFDKATMIFNDTVQELSKAVNQSNVTYYSTPPPTYKPKKTEQPTAVSSNSGSTGNNQTTSSKNNRKNTGKDKGWFLAKGAFKWPEGLSVDICNRYAQIGATCFRKNCDRKHMTFPDQFNAKDRELIHEFITKSEVLSFAQGVSYTPPAPTSNNSGSTADAEEPPCKKQKCEGEVKKEGGI